VVRSGRKPKGFFVQIVQVFPNRFDAPAGASFRSNFWDGYNNLFAGGAPASRFMKCKHE
jgi:hypothetical protein